MDWKRILGFITIVLGIVSILISFYIKGEVQTGKEKISGAEQRVAQGKKLFEIVPETKPLTEPFTEGLTAEAERRIGQGKRDVAKYEKIAEKLKIGGGALILLGIILLFLKRKKSRSR